MSREELIVVVRRQAGQLVAQDRQIREMAGQLAGLVEANEALTGKLAGLEDKFRPHFFGGVCTVVGKLLLQVTPDIATFGEKDYQQLKVVTAMARDLDIPAKIVGVPTVREKDGLALSSRNVYLSATERAAAPMLYRVLKISAERIKRGEKIDRILDVGRIELELAGFALDYLEARDALTLAPIASIKDGRIRLLVAAKLGKTRLIDNIAV